MLFDLILKDSTVLFLDKFYIPLDYFDRKVIFYDFKQFSAKLFVVMTIRLRRHTVLPLELPGKIAVVRKPRFHAHIQHFLFAGYDQLAGAMEADRGNILLKALVHGAFDKP